MRTLKPIALIAFIVLTAGGCTTTVRQHPAFAERRAKIVTVAVVPADVAFTRIVFKGDNQPLPEEAQRVRGRLPSLLAAELQKRGFTVRDAHLDEAAFTEHSDLRFGLSQLQDAYKRCNGEMFRTPQMSKSKAEKFETSVGPDVTQLAENADVDGLVFAKMNGFKKSGGEIARDWAVALLATAATLGTVVVTPAASSGATLQIALVDGTTGDVLWANTAGKAGDFEEKGLDGLVTQLFNGFPK